MGHCDFKVCLGKCAAAGPQIKCGSQTRGAPADRDRGPAKIVHP